MPRRRPGRPGKPVVGRERVLAGALALLEEGGLSAVTMRGLARRLRVDPMALYHYYGDRDALLQAAADVAYARLRVPATRTASCRARLETLATAYLELLAGAGELLRYVTARPGASRGPERRFEPLFRHAVASIALTPRQHRLARDTFVDFLHGFALALSAGLTASMRRRLRQELRLISAGILELARGGAQ